MPFQIPAWLVPILIGLAQKLGVAALKALFPNLPMWARPAVQALIEALEGIPHELSKAEKKALRKEAHKKAQKALREVHRGVGSSPDTKSL
jgi:hypothetical protein